MIISIQSQISKKEKQPFLDNHRTDWTLFRETLDSLITLNQLLKTVLDIATAVVHLTKNIQEVARFKTPDYKALQEKTKYRPQSSRKLLIEDSCGNNGNKQELQKTKEN